MVGECNELTPKQPVNITPTLKLPVLSLYGGKDQGGGLPGLRSRRLKEALAKGGGKLEFIVYPNFGYAFNADYRPSYVEADAKKWVTAVFGMI